MSLSAFCIEQREKEGKFLKSFLLYSLVTSSVIHCLALLGIRWFWEPFPALAEDPIEIIMVDAPEPPQPEPPQPEPPQPEPPQPEPPQPEPPQPEPPQPEPPQPEPPQPEPPQPEPPQPEPPQPEPPSAPLPPPIPQTPSTSIPNQPVAPLRNPLRNLVGDSESSSDNPGETSSPASPGSPGNLATNPLSAPGRPSINQPVAPSTNPLRNLVGSSESSPDNPGETSSLASPGSPGNIATNPLSTPGRPVAGSQPSSNSGNRDFSENWGNSDSLSSNPGDTGNQSAGGSPGDIAANQAPPPRPAPSRTQPSSGGRPSCVRHCNPRYPSSLDGEEGSASVRVVIDGSGNVVDVTSNGGGSDAIVQAAIKAARRMEFSNPGGGRLAFTVAVQFTVRGSDFAREARERQEQLEREQRERDRQEREERERQEREERERQQQEEQERQQQEEQERQQQEEQERQQQEEQERQQREEQERQQREEQERQQREEQERQQREEQERQELQETNPGV